MIIVFVGSRTLRLEKVANHLLQKLASLPIEVKVLLRGPREGVPEAFELLCYSLCQTLAIAVEWRRSEPGGRVAVFGRDEKMVRDADAVVAYFDEEHIMLGGTGHVVECAMNGDTPVYAYTYDDRGVRWTLGSEDGEDAAVYSAAGG